VLGLAWVLVVTDKVTDKVNDSAAPRGKRVPR
jgi:hypothetical protein